jgi:hypothetical protein
MTFPGPCVVAWFLPQILPQHITLQIWKACYGGGSLSDDGCPLPRHKVACFQELLLCKITAILFKSPITSDLIRFFLKYSARDT